MCSIEARLTETCVAIHPVSTVDRRDTRPTGTLVNICKQNGGISRLCFPNNSCNGRAYSLWSLPCATIKQARLPKEGTWLHWSFKSGTCAVDTSPWTPWSPHNFEHVQNSRTKVAKEVGWSKVAGFCKMIGQ